MRSGSAAEERGCSDFDEQICWPRRYLPSQARFAGLTGRFTGFSGQVGSGKSAALCFTAVDGCYINRGRRGVLAAPTLAMLRDATLAGMYEILAIEDVDFELRKSDGELLVRTLTARFCCARSMSRSGCGERI